MPYIDTEIWLALKSRTLTLVTAPTMPVYDPGATIKPPAAGLGQLPFIIAADLRNSNTRISIGGLVEATGTLVLTVCWPIASPATHAQLLEIAGAIVEHFPVDSRMRYGAACLRVTKRPDIIPPDRDGQFDQIRVRIFWSTT
jgi:hypothetical protein